MRTLHREQGMTLLMALIMLLVLTMLAITSFNMSKPNIQIVSNMQQRDEAVAAAQEVVEEVISRTIFSDTPAATLANPCDGVANTRCVDTNGDGVTDIKVALTPQPTCVAAKPKPNTELNVEIKDEALCIAPKDSHSAGIADSGGDASLCADSAWEITAVATDQFTDSKVTIKQGITMMVPVTKVQANCP